MFVPETLMSALDRRRQMPNGRLEPSEQEEAPKQVESRRQTAEDGDKAAGAPD
jgi:hypothetical protein